MLYYTIIPSNNTFLLNEVLWIYNYIGNISTCSHCGLIVYGLRIPYQQMNYALICLYTTFTKNKITSIHSQHFHHIFYPLILIGNITLEGRSCKHQSFIKLFDRQNSCQPPTLLVYWYWKSNITPKYPNLFSYKTIY